jgi:hypothetical protein
MNRNYANFRQAQTIQPRFCVYLRKVVKTPKINKPEIKDNMGLSPRVFDSLSNLDKTLSRFINMSQRKSTGQIHRGGTK